MAKNGLRKTEEQPEKYELYYGVDGSYALQPRPAEEPERKPQKRVSIKTKVAPQAKKMAVAVLAVAIGLGMMLSLVQRYAVIASNNVELNRAQEIIEKYEREEAYLDVELAKRGDIAAIGQTAREELDMNYPNDGQIFYFNYAGITTGAEKSAQSDKTANVFDSICEWVHDMIGRISA